MLAHLGSVDAVARAAAVCRALRRVVASPDGPPFAGVRRLTVRRAHVSLRAAAERGSSSSGGTAAAAADTLAAAGWLPRRFPDVGVVDARRAPALREEWLAALLAALPPRLAALRVDGAPGWTGRQALPELASHSSSGQVSLRRLSVAGTAFDVSAPVNAVGGLRGLPYGLTSLSLAGAEHGAARCAAHRVRLCVACARDDPPALAALIACGRRLRRLDLSGLPGLEQDDLERIRVDATALAAAAAVADSDDDDEDDPVAAIAAELALSTDTPDFQYTPPPLPRLQVLRAAGCAALRPLRLSSFWVHRLRELDASGTATDDFDVAHLLHTAQLRRLALSGADLGDDGLRALARAACVADGRLVALAVGRLPRAGAGAFDELFERWGAAAASRALRGGGSSSDDDNASSSSDDGDSDSEASNAAPRCWPQEESGACRPPPRRLLSVDVSGSAAFGASAVRALLAGARRARERWDRGDDWRRGADEAALGARLRRLNLGAGAAAGSGRGSGGGDQGGGRGRLGLRALLAAGTRVDPAALLQLWDEGWLARLEALDLSHSEPFRVPWDGGGADAGGAPAEEGGGAEGPSQGPRPHPLALALAHDPGAPRALRVLRLDGAHLTDEAAAAIGARCGAALRELSVIGCRPLGAAGLRAFVAHCTALRSLAVGGAGAHWREDEALAPGSSGSGSSGSGSSIAAAAPLQHLTSLRVARRAHMTDAQLAAVIARCPRLRALALAGCYSVTDELFAPRAASASASASDTAAAAARVMRSRLTELSLVAMDASFTGAGLARLTSLRRLKLQACAGVTGPALQLVVASCDQLAELELPAHIKSLALPARGSSGTNVPRVRTSV